jgi:hypothetical protein
MADENHEPTDSANNNNNNEATALISTKTDSLDSNDDETATPTTTTAAGSNSLVLYENDFDLYSLVKEMILAKSASAAAVKRTTRKHSFKSYTKQLTARMLDSHYTNGRTSWCLEQNGIDLYRSKVKCIGTDVNDFDYGQPVYLDLQPLSTRIKLMCKLIIIIQGACVERNGPPKLVQDRCTQFDEDTLTTSTMTTVTPGSTPDKSSSGVSNATASPKRNNSMVKKRSNSCENILESSDQDVSLEIESEKVRGETTTTSPSTTGDVEINISIYGTSKKNDAVVTSGRPLTVAISNGFKRKLSRKKSFRSTHSSAMTSTAVATTNCFSDDEFSSSTTITSTTSLNSPRGCVSLKPISKLAKYTHRGINKNFV